MAEVFQMPTAAGDGIELIRYEDIIFTNIEMTDPKSGVEYAKVFKYKPGDLIMATYPKCGTHWLGNMIWKMKTFDESRRPKDAPLEFGPPELFENMDTPRIIFSHMKPNRLPDEHIEKGGKIVLMLRNPKDAMVSYYHHMKNSALWKSKQTWDEYFKSYIDGLIPFGSYFDYLQQWEQFVKDKSDDLQVEIFYYEDFKSNVLENLRRLNNFLGFNRDEKYMERVKDATTLSALRQQDASGKRATNEFAKNEKGDSIIYRKGEVGDWKNYLTVAQSETVDRLMEETLKYGIINMKYEI